MFGTSLLFYVVYDCLSLSVVMNVCYGGIVVRSMFSSLLQVKTVASTNKLAQASWPRLGEINRGSPKPFPRMVAQATRYLFERANVSLRRGGSRLSENACKATTLEVELSPRRGKLA